MQPTSTPLGIALRAHRESHKDCRRGCSEYLAIAVRATQTRVIQEGPRMAYSWLSIREAQNA